MAAQPFGTTDVKAMNKPRFKPPSPKPEINNPDLWRPTQYDDVLRPKDMLWLDRGECLDPALIKIVMSELQQIPRDAVFAYPTPGPLYRKLAKHIDVPVEHLLLTRGSDGAIRAVFEAYISIGDTVLLTEPTYQMYGVYSQMFGAKVETVPFTLVDNSPYLDVPALIAAIEKIRPKLVGLPNPDNPTGFSFSGAEIIEIIEAAGNAGALILVDEAYYPFLDETALPLLEKYDHLVIARTFSKAWGMAGIRLGYTIAGPEITANLNKVRNMVEADGVSMALAERMLDRHKDVEKSVRTLKEGRKIFTEQMLRLGFHAIETSGNFVHVDFGDRRRMVEKSIDGCVSYRVFPVAPLENFIRFTTTTTEQFARVVELIEPIAGNPS